MQNPVIPTLRRTDRAQPTDALDDVGAAVGAAERRHVLHRLGRIAAAEAPVEVGGDGCVALVREPLADPEQLRGDAVALHHDDDAGPRRWARGHGGEERNGDLGHWPHAIEAPYRYSCRSCRVVAHASSRSATISTRSSTRSPSAFHDDPVWSWAFPDEERRPEQFRRWWPLFVESAIAARTYLDGRARGDGRGVDAARPAGAHRRSRSAASRGCSIELLGDSGPPCSEALLQFEAAHPHDEPHYYLSFVATQTITVATASASSSSRRTSCRSTPSTCPRISSRATRRISHATSGSVSCPARSSRFRRTARP